MRKPNHRGPDLMEVRRLWGHGMTDDQIAASMGISTRSAQRARLKAGLRRPKGRHADAAPGVSAAPATYYPLSGQEADTAIRLYLDGRTDKEIAGELQDAINLRTAFAACKRSMAAAGLDVSGAKYVKDLAPILEDHVPEELADVAKELAADPDVAELRQALEDCANNGNLSDAIYYPADKVNWEEAYA